MLPASSPPKSARSHVAGARPHADRLEAYVERTQAGPCFICQIVAGELPHHIVYEDEQSNAFLNAYPTLFGHTLVAPRAHHEQVTGDFSTATYLALQRVVYRVAEAIRLELAPQRVYILSLGSQQ